MSLHLHIDRLVLEGTALSPRDAARLQAALSAELQTLLQARELHSGLARGTALPTFPAAPLSLPSAPNPQAFGRQLAGHLADTLAPGPKP
jgi:hypothetical protein